MDKAGPVKNNRKDIIDIEELIKELRKDMPAEPPALRRKAPPGSNLVYEVLSRAADDPKFLARMAENPFKAMQEYDLSPDEMAALVSGDLRQIESWIGKLDTRLSTWIWCRLQLEKW